MKIGNIIKEYRINHNLSMQSFADKCGLSKGYISMLEKGKHPQNGKEIIPSIDTVQKIASAMGITVDNLLEAVDSDQPIVVSRDFPATAPVYSAAAGKGRLNDGYPNEEYPMRLDDDEFLFRVAGRSMEPTLRDDDLVVVAVTNVVEDSDQIALVQINGDEATLKHVQQEENGIMLIAENYSVFPPKHYSASQVEQLPVRILGIVKTIIRNI